MKIATKCADPDCQTTFEPGDMRAATSRGDVCIADAPRFHRLPTSDGRWITVEDWPVVGTPDLVVRMDSLGDER